MYRVLVSSPSLTRFFTFLPTHICGGAQFLRSLESADSFCPVHRLSQSHNTHTTTARAPPLWEVPRREVRVMREDTLLHVSRRTEDTLKIHLCEDTRPGPNEEVYLHTKIHLGPNEDVYLHTKIHRGPNEVCILKIHRRKCIMLYL